jgi:hypothetical protein
MRRIMNKATFHSLTAAEQALVLETEPPRLLEFDEDELLALHDRVRRERKKALSVYRRQASARVEAKGSRGKARLGAPGREALKAEVWEECLGRVSARLASLARASAKALKDERLAAAKGELRVGTPTPTTKKAATQAPRARTTPPVEKKTRASSKSAGARRQAARDAR